MILVSDTSVLIDLDRGRLLDAVFRLPDVFAVPDVLYQRELSGEWGERLIKHGLRVEEVSGQGVADAIRYRYQRPSLSVADSLALALAKERQWTLLTGDNDLRLLASAERVECHGVLWLLDLIEEADIIAVRLLHDGLEAISTHPRCRLPRR
jgi:predicted nucleic acid-binding protein